MQTKFRKTVTGAPSAAWMRYRLPAVAAVLVLWGCLAASPPVDSNRHHLPIEAFWTDSRCGCEARQPVLRWLTDPARLDAAAAAVRSPALKTRIAQHPVDWKRFGLVWIDMGLKPSGGYALNIAESSATVSEGVATIIVRWRQPKPGSVVTQQLTSPCLLVTLARGNFHTIQIRDEAGRVRARLELDAQ
jgi:hypothetical protein